MGSEIRKSSEVEFKDLGPLTRDDDRLNARCLTLDLVEAVGVRCMYAYERCTGLLGTNGSDHPSAFSIGHPFSTQSLRERVNANHSPCNRMYLNRR